MINLKEEFEKHDDDYLEFEKIKKPLSNRPDLSAFLMLEKLVPGVQDMVDSAEHDEIWLSVSPKDLAKVATSEDVLYLVRCGVRYEDNIDSLCMFV